MARVLPWYSQYESFADPERQKRGCGIVALKIVMEFWDPSNKSVSVEKLYDKGLELGAYLQTIGWKHQGIVALAKEYGFDGYNRDYAPQSPTPKTLEESFIALRQELELGPVIASCWLGFDPASKNGHLVVVSEVVGDMVTISDPAGDSKESRISIEEFLKGFRQRYIVVRPI